LPAVTSTMASQGILIEVPGADNVDNTVTIDGASMVPSSMQGTDTVYDTQGGGPMQYSLVELGKRLLSSSRDGDTVEVKALINKGAPFTTDWLGTSPLHLAAKYGHTDTCAVLLRAGISKDARTKVDKTPVHIAAQEGHSDVLELLLKNGSDVEAVDMINMTALHWAVDRGNVSAVEVMLKFGADVNAESKFDKTPLEIASDNARPDIYEMLQNAEQFRAMMPAISSLDKIVPLMSDPATLAATRSIALNSSPHPGLEDLELATESSTVPNSQKTEAMKLLEAHGITLLPEDNGGSSNMIHSGGRATLALSEAGKMMLSSSSSTTQHLSNKGTTIVKSVTARTLAAPSGTVQKPTIVRLTSGVNAASVTKVSTPTVTRVVRASTILGAHSTSSSSVSSPTKSTTATAGGIVIRTGSAQNQVTASGNKAPRIIKISPEQFAALKSGTAGAKIGALLSPSKSRPSPMSSTATTTTTTRVISSTGGISRVIATSGPSLGSSNAAARKTYKIVRVSTNNSSGGGDPNTPSNIRIPAAIGSTSAVRVKMEPGLPLPGDSNKSPHPSAVVVHDSEVPAAAAPEAPSIDNAALMKQLQEAQKAIADAKRAAEDAQKTAEAVKQELAREKQKVEQLEKEKENTTTTTTQSMDRDLSSPLSPPPLPPPSGMVTRKRKKSMRESGGETTEEEG